MSLFRQKRHFFSISLVLFFSVFLLQYGLCLAGEKEEVSLVVHTLSFGVVDLHPCGDTITIDASQGEARATCSRSLCPEGRSGMVELRSQGDVDVTIQYPDTVLLVHGNSGRNVALQGIGKYSQYANKVIHLSPNTRKQIHIGGAFVFSGTEVEGSYSGQIPLQVNFE